MSCPEGKLRNPKTNRCVKIDGRIGKQVLKEQEKKEKTDIVVLKPKNKRNKTENTTKIKPKSVKQTKTTENATKIESNIERQKTQSNSTKQIADATKNDKIYFYSKSKDVAPGKGANEVIAKPELYKELSQISDFRKVLSNFHVCPFNYYGYTYNSIEHVFQAQKTALVSYNDSMRFTRESGDPIGRGDGHMAQKNRYLVTLSKEDLQKWAEVKDQIMFDAALQKYKQCPEALKVLKATNNAQLWHIVSRSKPVRFTHLEKIRDML